MFSCLKWHSSTLEEFAQEHRGPVIPPPRTMGSLFVASYDSQGYNGGILTRFHTHVNRFYAHGLSPPPI
jgi:hypothetical protein